MDSGSTAMAIFLFVSVLAFAAAHGADAALPRLRRGGVRDSLEARGLREAAIRRLRTSRSAYEELVRVLAPVSMASAAALTLGLAARATDLPWPLAALVVAGATAGVLLLGALAERIVMRLTINQLILFGTGFQMILWVLLPVRRVVRLGVRQPVQWEETSGNGPSPEGADRVEPEMQIEEQIAEEPLERHERAMIRAILQLDETPVREIMVPRVDVISIDVSTTLDEAVPRMLESGHSRLPVYEQGADNIIGILYSRDLLAATVRGRGAAPPTLRDLLRPCFFVPESKRVDEMLTEFQERRVHLAVVVDEYGGVAGIVTIEDLLEEIVGEIEDEFDVDEPNVDRRASGYAVVDARMPVDKFNEEFNVGINAEGFDTLGGFLFSRLGRIPVAGDLVVEKGLRMQVATTAGRRIKKVNVMPQPAQAEEPAASEQASEKAADAS